MPLLFLSLIILSVTFDNSAVYGMAKPKLDVITEDHKSGADTTNLLTQDSLFSDTLKRITTLEKKLLDSAEFCVLLAEHFSKKLDFEKTSILILPAFEYYYYATFDSNANVDWERANQIYKLLVDLHWSIRKYGIIYKPQSKIDFAVVEKSLFSDIKEDTLKKHLITLLKKENIDTAKHLEKIAKIYRTVDGKRNVQPLKPQLQNIPLVYNDRVQAKINYFKNSEKGRKQFDIYLSRISHMDPRIIPILREEGIPEEIICLAIVESALKHDAVSRAKATGIYQFMKETALKYGLQVNEWYDERYNVEKSTRAASLYLRKLYEEDFQDWHLTMAAYNAGEGRIKRSINNQLGISFWRLKRGRGLFRIPKETYNYVPQILAVIDIYKNLEIYGFQKPKLVNKIDYEEIEIEGIVGFDVLSEITGISLENLSEMNPEYLNLMTDPTRNISFVKVPLGMGKLVQTKLNSLSENEKIFWVNYMSPKNPIHLDELAKRFQLTPEAIKEYGNNRSAISHNRVKPRKQLYFPILLSVAKQQNLVAPQITLNESKNDFSETIVKGDSTIENKTVKEHLTPSSKPTDLNSVKFVHAKKGDSLAKIAKRYNVDLKKLIEWNNKQENPMIHPKEKIYISDPRQ